jgi:hypothetical protein
MGLRWTPSHFPWSPNGDRGIPPRVKGSITRQSHIPSRYHRALDTFTLRSHRNLTVAAHGSVGLVVAVDSRPIAASGVGSAVDCRPLAASRVGSPGLTAPIPICKLVM